MKLRLFLAIGCLLIPPSLTASEAPDLTDSIFAEVDTYLGCLERFDEQTRINSRTTLLLANERCGDSLRRLEGIAPAVSRDVQQKLQRKIEREAAR